MKEILKKIIENYFAKDEVKELFSYDLELDNSLLIIKSKKQNEEPSDFFYFIFIDEKNFDNFDDSEIFKELKNKKIENDNFILGEIPSFDKNLNFLIFVEVNDDKFLIESNNNLTDNEKKLLEKAYLLEENALYARKKVMFYSKRQVENFRKNFVEIDKIFKEKDNFGKVEDDIKDLNKRFILNLLTVLTFIKIEFTNSSSTENNIFKKSFEAIRNDLKFDEEELEINNFQTFNDKIEEMNSKEYDILNIKENKITEFEKDLIGLFDVGNNLEKDILEPLNKK